MGKDALQKYRANVKVCEELVAKLYSDSNVRSACLVQLAESILDANAISASSWGVTLHEAEIRLNVGTVEAVVLSREALSLTLDKSATTDDEWTRVTDQPGVKFKWGGGPFKIIPSAYGVIVSGSHVESRLPDLQPLHAALVTRAANAVQSRTRYFESHSPGVMAFLRREIADDLPDPDYAVNLPHKGAQFASERENPSPDEPDSTARIWWVNQGNTFDAARAEGLIAAPLEDKLGREPVHWRTVSEVSPGDIFVHCVGGQIRALGRATSGPTDDLRPVATTDPSVPEWMQKVRRVDIEYFDLKPPITVSEIADQVRRLHIAQGPFSVDGGLKQGYLFRFSIAGLKVLRGANDSDWPPWAQSNVRFGPADNDTVDELGQKARQRSFSSLLKHLYLDGLHFSAETVGNYLLALQTKRFVILTGISGTGKTQLALAVARHFRKDVRPPEATLLSVGTHVEKVKPYMRDNKRYTLPTSVAASLHLPSPGDRLSERQARVIFPQGEQHLTLSRSPNDAAATLLFKGEFCDWFMETFSVGDSFAIEPIGPDDGAFHGFRFSVPTDVQRSDLSANHIVSAVRPDWSDNRGLLGYFNPLVDSYATTPFLRLLLGAHAEGERAEREGREPAPFFVILDEMNLARVEHYFSDFLSALESGEPIHLHDHEGIEEGETEDSDRVPRSLRVPDNVFFTGTVNVDETTYMFSPKVLDRAFTIELSHVDLKTFGSEQPNEETAFALSRFAGSLGTARKPNRDDWVAFCELMDGALRQVVLDIHMLLTEEDRHFGYRVANEIARFVLLANEQTDGGDEALWTALDLAVLQKILPKFHGTQQELEDVLTRLSEFVAPLPLPRTAAKIGSMQRRLKRQGFTSFIE